MCFGVDDKLVLYKVGVLFIKVVRVRGVEVDERVYEGVGYVFLVDMVNDVVEFLVDVVLRGLRKEKVKM